MSPGISPGGPGPAVVEVIGHGLAGAAPEQMVAQVVASAVRDSLVEALTGSERAAAAMRSALAAHGVDRQDVTTEGLAIHPDHQWRGEGVPPAVGYRSDHRLQVILRDLSSAGRILGEALAAGGDDVQLGRVGFEVADRAALQVRARQAAWADARSRAEQYAELAGRRLSAVLAVCESVPGEMTPRGDVIAFSAREMEGGPPMTIEPGSVMVPAIVNVRWELV